MKIKYCVGDIVHIKDTFYNGSFDLLRVRIEKTEESELVDPSSETPNKYEIKYWVNMDGGHFLISQADIIELK